MTAAALPAAKQPKWRLALYAFGDFAFNLYWQSLMLLLLFYYTETLGVSIAAAAAIYLFASLFDGAIGFVIGLWIDRRTNPALYPSVLVLGAAPLGLAFVLAYSPPGGNGPLSLALLCVGQLLFRLAYAVTNLSYLAMSARVSVNPADRSLVAGMRMTFGTIAALIVSLTTRPLGTLLSGSEAHAFVASALLFACVATAVLILVGLTFRDVVPARPAVAPEQRRFRSVRSLLGAVLVNRSFLSVAAAMVAMVIGVTMVSKSVLYYFKYAAGSTRAGELALADMTLVGLIAVPLWMAVERRIGTRRTWAAAVSAALVLLAALAVAGAGSAAATNVFLALFQGSVMGLNFALWSLLPATIDAGELESGTRVEATVYGLVAMLQRISIGVATAMIGLNLQLAGLHAGSPLSAGSSFELRLQISLIPFVFLAASAVLILLDRRILPFRAVSRSGRAGA